MIKKIIFLLIVLLPSFARAQDSGTETGSEVRQNSIKLYPFAFIKSRFAISYERALQNRWSAQVGLGLASNDYSNFYDGRDLFGFSADLQLRKYLQPNRDRLEGIYVAPHIGFKALEYTTSNYYYIYPNYLPEEITFSSTLLHGGLVMGYQLQILKVVTADVYAGGGYRHTDPNYKPINGFSGPFDASAAREYLNNGIYPIMGLQAGVLF